VNGPLDGLRVLDLTRYIAGPYCAQMLGDFGAEIVKVETPGKGDELRGPGAAAGQDDVYWVAHNRNKRSLTLDLRKPEGQALLRELATKADVLLENFRPGILEKMGCAPDTLRAINPRLIVARISGFGQDGPWADRPAYDAIGQATSGIMALTGARDGPPTMAGVVALDYTTGLHATIGVMMAVKARETSGRGQVVEASLFETGVSLLMSALSDQIMRGYTRPRDGNRDQWSAPTNTFRAADGGWVHIMGVTDAQFAGIARAMGKPELAQDPRFSTRAARVANIDAAERLVGDWAATVPADDIERLLLAESVPAAKVASLADVAAHPQLAHRQQIWPVEHPGLGTVPVQGNPVRLSDTPARQHRAAPLLGQHSDEVLRDWLGCDAARVEALRRDRVI